MIGIVVTPRIPHPFGPVHRYKYARFILFYLYPLYIARRHLVIYVTFQTTAIKMVSFSTISCIAPIVFAVLATPATGASTAVKIGASVAGSVLGHAGSDHKSNDHKSSKREEQALREPTFINCLRDAHRTPPTMTYNQDEKTVEMHEVPESCMHQVNAYHRHPDVEYMNQAQGKILSSGPNSLYMSNFTHDEDFHSDLMKKFGEVAPVSVIKVQRTGAQDLKGAAAAYGHTR